MQRMQSQHGSSFWALSALILLMSGLGTALALALQPTDYPRARQSPAPSDVAVDGLTTDARVLEVFPSTGVHSLAYRSGLAIRVTVKNVGTQATGRVRVRLALRDESLKRDLIGRHRSLASIRSGESRLVVFPGIPANQGSVNRLEVSVAPIPGEEDLDDNTLAIRYVMSQRP